MSRDKTIALWVNGKEMKTTVPPHRTLLEALRELGHMEVKCGCEKGDCGACAVLIDDVAFDSCLILAWTVEGSEITTVSGLGSTDAPHPLHKSFADTGAVQCGYCTPGLIIAAHSMISENPEPDEADIRLGLSGNLCRCTGYGKVFEAVTEAAAVMRKEGRSQ